MSVWEAQTKLMVLQKDNDSDFGGWMWEELEEGAYDKNMLKVSKP